MNTQQPATPGKWSTPCCDPVPGDYKKITVMDGGEYGEIIAEVPICYGDRDKHIQDARFICAAVNACRKAGYGVDRLEAGCLKRDIETGQPAPP